MSDGKTIARVTKINALLRQTRYPFERPGTWVPTPDPGESEVDREKRERDVKIDNQKERRCVMQLSAETLSRAIALRHGHYVFECRDCGWETEQPNGRCPRCHGERFAPTIQSPPPAHRIDRKRKFTPFLENEI